MALSPSSGVDFSGVSASLVDQSHFIALVLLFEYNLPAILMVLMVFVTCVHCITCTSFRAVNLTVAMTMKLMTVGQLCLIDIPHVAEVIWHWVMDCFNRPDKPSKKWYGFNAAFYTFIIKVKTPADLKLCHKPTQTTQLPCAIFLNEPSPHHIFLSFFQTG